MNFRSPTAGAVGSGVNPSRPVPSVPNPFYPYSPQQLFARWRTAAAQGQPANVQLLLRRQWEASQKGYLNGKVVSPTALATRVAPQASVPIAPLGTLIAGQWVKVFQRGVAPSDGTTGEWWLVQGSNGLRGWVLATPGRGPANLLVASDLGL